MLSQEGDKWSVKFDVRDLGEHLDTTFRGWSATLASRVRIVISRLVQIFALPLDFHGRVRVVRSMYLLAALHGVEASLLASDSLRKLRSSVHRGGLVSSSAFGKRWCFARVSCCRTLAGDIPMGVPRVTGAAQRRKQRRIRSWWRHEQVSVFAAFATALHHSSQRDGGVVRHPTGTEDSGNSEEEVHVMYGALRRQNRPPPGRRLEPLEEVSEPQAGIGRHTGVFYELVLNPVVPQMAEQLVNVSLPALAVEYISPAPAVSQASSPVVEYIAPVPAVVHAPTPVVETVAPAPAVFQATPVEEYSAPAPAVFQATPVEEYSAPAPAVFHATPVEEFFAPAPAVVQAPTSAVEFVAPLSVVFQAPTPAVEYITPVPAVVQAPTPAVEYIAPAPAVVLSLSSVVEFVAPAPALSEAPSPGVESLSHAPVLSRWLAPGVDHFSPAPAVSHAVRGRGLQDSVSGQSSTSRRGHDLPLPSGWLRAEDASGRVYFWHVHTRQTRWTPPVSDDEDEDVEVEEDEEEEDEEVEDDGMDEIYAESRFPAGFWPMRMCRWFPSGNCRQGWGCMFAHSVSELHTLARGQGP